MKVIILTAGEGTRTKKLFPGTPKALIPINERPALEYLIDQYKGFDIFINVRANEAKSFKYLKLPLLVEETPLGNAGAVKYFSKELGDKFIATHTDILSDLDPKRLAASHKGCATMAVKDLSKPKNFGVITHEGGLVTGFTRRRLINCGIYSFSKEVIEYIGKGFQDFDKDLFPRLISAKKLYIYEHEGAWEDIGTQDYWKKTR
ncbi:MAG: nucleotidyltransferase family protein [Candidatus Omnitrophica bacterium]|nr:nucleotidyltransferase family protein [Candidatus Omnitrophota bacterium]